VRFSFRCRRRLLWLRQWRGFSNDVIPFLMGLLTRQLTVCMIPARGQCEYHHRNVVQTTHIGHGHTFTKSREENCIRFLA
jgi:hypothetical protein